MALRDDAVCLLPHGENRSGEQIACIPSVNPQLLCYLWRLHGWKDYSASQSAGAQSEPVAGEGSDLKMPAEEIYLVCHLTLFAGVVNSLFTQSMWREASMQTRIQGCDGSLALAEIRLGP